MLREGDLERKNRRMKSGGKLEKMESRWEVANKENMKKKREKKKGEQDNREKHYQVKTNIYRRQDCKCFCFA